MTVGLSLQTIREALATQIGNYLARGTSVFAYDPGDSTYPRIVVNPASSYVAYFGTMGPNGIADILLDVVIEVAVTQLASAGIAMDDYLSAGTGNTSSVVDAIHSDRFLGGVVADCVCLTADAPDLSADPITAVLHVQIIVHKIGAQT